MLVDEARQLGRSSEEEVVSQTLGNRHHPAEIR